MTNSSLKNWFSVLGVLSIVGNAIYFIVYGLALLLMNLFEEQFKSMDTEDMFEMFESMMTAEAAESYMSIMQAMPILASINFVSALGSLVGVIMLFKQNVQGFIWYFTAQVVGLILPVLLIDKFPFNFIGFLFTGIFVYVFWRYTQLLKSTEIS